LIGIPAYAGTVHLGTMRSLMADVLALARRGDSVSVYDESGSAMIADTRAQIVAEFLAGQATHLVMVDHDVCWQAGGIPRLVDHGVDCVAGVYPHRADPISFPLHLLDDGADGWDAEKQLLEVKAVPAGFLCITRGMCERMIAAYPETAFVSDKHPDRKAHALFDSVRIGMTKLGEDLSFCHRWRAIGGKVWADPSIMMAHVGPKVFAGALGTFMGGIGGAVGNGT
jgi:hypothetical protein